MGGIRKVSHTPRRQNFRSRLQRALSLSSSESEDTGSPSRSATGDTTEDESTFQEEHDSGDQDNSTSADETEQEAARQRKTVFGHVTDLETRGETQLSGDSNSVALKCLTELDNRMRSIERSSHDQATWNETIRNDLADIYGRLAIVESEIQKGTRQGSNKAIEGQKIGRSLRRQK
ncbi:hypothetical protein PENARI_c172G06730 [Penicillium arizonense]|uniref:Uncharacterized protein n=1 Tax=Penicillium arizonense TaxID=1835702 RepID=A0A1F5L083_PENAI|nr:hypothetical protein PENARI_c172G06730 [Penicillium arizonense]OGE46595.1 hypothetical protein PENARI_c172G06730 [Penicillium arizonense]